MVFKQRTVIHFLILLMSLVSSCSLIQKTREKNIQLSLQPLREFSKKSFLTECSIYDYRLQKTARFPGFICQFFKNGDVVLLFGDKDDSDSFYNHSIKFFSSDLKSKWVYPGDNHHELSIYDDRLIVALGSKGHIHSEERVRFDTITVLDKEGEVVYELDTHMIYEKIFSLMGQKLDIGYHKKRKFYELFHVNSASIIPEQFNESYNGKKGDVLIATTFPRLNAVIVFNLKTSEIVWSFKTFDSIMLHQASVLSTGNILFFVNDWVLDKFQGETGVMDFFTTEEDIYRKKYSSVLEVSPKKRIVYRIDGNGPVHFYSKYKGGVIQTDDGNLLVTLQDGWVLEVDKKNKKIIATWPLADHSGEGIYRTSQLGHKEYELILKKNKLNCMKKSSERDRSICRNFSR